MPSGAAVPRRIPPAASTPPQPAGCARGLWVLAQDAYRYGRGKSHSRKRFGAIGLQQQSPASSGGDHLLAAAVARELKQRAGEESGDCGRDDCQD